LESTKYLNIGDIEYTMNDDEILYLYSTIISDNFDKLIPMPTNEYVQNISYDFANPISSTNTRDISLTEQYSNTTNASFGVLSKECVSKIGQILVDTNNWHLKLHDGAKEYNMNTSVQCSFYIILNILKTHLQLDENIYDIKRRLCTYYKPLIQTYLLKMCDIFTKQDKPHVNLLKKKQIKLDVMIMHDNYVLTAIEYWVLATNMNLPIILFHSNSSLPLTTEFEWLCLGGNPETDHFYFIRMISNNQYNLITPPSMLRDLNGFQEMIESSSYTEHFKTLDEYIKDYEIAVPKLKIRAPRKKKA
jgi:hypothetical protein